MTRVVLAEDDPAISEPLARALLREGYTVDVAADGLAALAAAKAGTDLLILDLGLPELDGLEVCRRLRVEGSTLPILVLTARADEVDTVVGLDAGADDYVTKPFRLAELLARARALLRRGVVESSAADPFLRIDADARRAWFGDTELHLAPKEFDLLALLVSEEGKVVPRDQIMKEIWGTRWMSSTKTLDMHISVLRRKLGDDATAPTFITTVRGVGFRFDAPVTTRA
ncbi:MAG: response regulator transcription factor [Dermatophilaceae bacterium]|nr:response regulator transcription factor [Intrasporangiaceae bacterium]